MQSPFPYLHLDLFRLPSGHYLSGNLRDAGTEVCGMCFLQQLLRAPRIPIAMYGCLDFKIFVSNADTSLHSRIKPSPLCIRALTRFVSLQSPSLQAHGADTTARPYSFQVLLSRLGPSSRQQQRSAAAPRRHRWLRLWYLWCPPWRQLVCFVAGFEDFFQCLLP